MEKTDVIKKRFSDLIEDKYKSWKDTRIEMCVNYIMKMLHMEKVLCVIEGILLV